MNNPGQPMHEDDELLSAAAQGDRDALNALLARYLPKVRAFVRMRAGAELRAHESCSDLVQSVCREILQHADRFRHASGSGFERWLYTTALRKIQNRQRFWTADKRDARREIALEGGGRGDSTESERGLLDCYGSFATPSQRVMVAEEVARIEAAFEKLSGDHREVISLARIAGLSAAEIAEEMGRSEGAVRVLLHRAMVQLARLLDLGK